MPNCPGYELAVAKWKLANQKADSKNIKDALFLYKEGCIDMLLWLGNNQQDPQFNARTKQMDHIIQIATNLKKQQGIQELESENKAPVDQMIKAVIPMIGEQGNPQIIELQQAASNQNKPKSNLK